MNKPQQRCSQKHCEAPVYLDGMCHYHFKRTDRVQNSGEDVTVISSEESTTESAPTNTTEAAPRRTTTKKKSKAKAKRR